MGDYSPEDSARIKELDAMSREQLYDIVISQEDILQKLWEAVFPKTKEWYQDYAYPGQVLVNIREELHVRERIIDAFLKNGDGFNMTTAEKENLTVDIRYYRRWNHKR